MIELVIGTRFLYKKRLCEIVEIKQGGDCRDCAITAYRDCAAFVCFSRARQDNKNVCFKWVEE